MAIEANDNEAITFSVVVPVFNGSGTIERALKSVIDQESSVLETIVVDDASTDDTAAIVRRFSSEHPQSNIRYVRLAENAGPAAARNAGWNLARGTHIAFLDADDEWTPDKTRQQLNLLRGPASGAVLLGSLFPSFARRLAPLFRVSRSQILRRNLLITPSAVIRRDVPFRFDERLRRCEDHLLFCRLTLAYDRTFFSAAPVVVEHKLPVSGGGLSQSLWKMQLGNWRMYELLYRDKVISLASFLALEVWSTLKWIVRPFRVAAWRLRARLSA